MRIVAPALCEAVLSDILDAALDVGPTSAVGMEHRAQAILSACRDGQAALRFLRTIDRKPADDALASILILDDWSDESLWPVAGAYREGGESAKAVRTLVVGHRAEPELPAGSAMVKLARIVGACEHAESVILLGSCIQLHGPVARCQTLAIVSADWRQLDRILPLFPALQTLHMDALARPRARELPRITTATAAVLCRLDRLSLGVGSLDCAKEVVKRCSNLTVRRASVGRTDSADAPPQWQLSEPPRRPAQARPSIDPHGRARLVRSTGGRRRPKAVSGR